MEESKESTPAQETKPIEHVEKEKKPGIFSRLTNRFIQYRRVLEIAIKPDRPELISSIKVTMLGIAMLGIIGFVIFLAYFIIIP